MEAQSISGSRLDEEYKSAERMRLLLNEADDEVLQTVREVIEGKPISALIEDSVPLTILEITEIKGIGAKMARAAYDDLGVKDLQSLKECLEDGRLSKVKGFGPKMIEKIQAHLSKEQKKQPKSS